MCIELNRTKKQCDCSCFSPGDFHHIESHKAQSPAGLGIPEIKSGKMEEIVAHLKVDGGFNSFEKF